MLFFEIILGKEICFRSFGSKMTNANFTSDSINIILYYSLEIYYFQISVLYSIVIDPIFLR